MDGGGESWGLLPIPNFFAGTDDGEEARWLLCPAIAGGGSVRGKARAHHGTLTEADIFYLA